MTVAHTTVIIPTHDHADLLDYSIKSVLRQSFADLALVVIGDGVGDDTRDVVADAMRTDARVAFIDRAKSPRNGEAVRHELITSVESPVIAYQGDDDLWLPDHLAVMIELLDGVDFVHPLPVLVGVDGELAHIPTDLARQECIDWHRSEFRNAVSLTGVVHTRESYLRLPWGWRQTPPGRWTDHYMWQQYFGLEGLRARTSARSTTIKLPSPDRDSMTPQERTAEMQRWWKRVSTEADFGERWQAAVHEVVRRTAVSLLLAEAAKVDELASVVAECDALRAASAAHRDVERELAALRQQMAALVAERDVVRAALADAEAAAARDHVATAAVTSTLRAEQIRLGEALDAVHDSTSWRVTRPLRAIGDVLKRRR